MRFTTTGPSARPAPAVAGTLLIFLAVALVLFPATGAAAGTALDPSYGQGGVVVTPAPSTAWNGTVLALTEDRKGRIVAAGETNSDSFGVLRYLPGGALDTSFRGGGGFLERDPSYTGGLVETRFGGESAARDVAVLPDGDILAAGSAATGSGPGSSGSFVLARYTEGGARDSSFGKGGRVITHVGENDGGAFAIAIQPNGKILAAGFRETRTKRTEGLLIRYMANGALDRHFGSGGEVRFSVSRGQARLTDVSALPNGKILVAGGFHGSFLLARLLPNGHPDSGFGERDGRVLTDVDGSSYCVYGQCAYADTLVMTHGSITLAGNASNRQRGFAAVTRYTTDGRLDRKFGKGGIVRMYGGRDLGVERMAIGSGERIVLAGHREVSTGIRAVVLRLLPDGRPDAHFARRGSYELGAGYQSAAFAALAQRAGVVVGGYVKLPPPPHSELEAPLANARFTLMRFK